MYRVVFMGTPDFAVDALKALIEAPMYEVAAVFTQPDRPKGRGGAVAMSPVKETALAAQIPVFQPQKIRDEASWETLQTIAPDFIVVVAFGQLIPKRILDLPPFGCINVHASLLPKYRGAAPIQWAILNGETESGVTTMRMDEGLDTGDMIQKVVVPLAADETGGSLFDRLSREGAALLLRTLDAVAAGTASYEAQPAQSPTAYASMLKRETGKIDWTADAARIERLVRAMDPWPSAYTHRGGKMLKIWRAAVVDGLSGQAGNSTQTACAVPSADLCGGQQAAPGTVVYVDKTSLYVQTGDGILSLLEVQPEGKKRMPVDAYLRGYPVQVGETF